MTFEQWRDKVDLVLISRIGLSGGDLPDVDYRSMHEDGFTPQQCVKYILEENGF